MGSALCICFGRRAGNRDVGLVAFILAFVVDYSSQENVFEQSGRFLKGHRKTVARLRRNEKKGVQQRSGHEAI
jgi:hypothetical protein